MVSAPLRLHRSALRSGPGLVDGHAAEVRPLVGRHGAAELVPGEVVGVV